MSNTILFFSLFESLPQFLFVLLTRPSYGLLLDLHILVLRVPSRLWRPRWGRVCRKPASEVGSACSRAALSGSVLLFLSVLEESASSFSCKMRIAGMLLAAPRATFWLGLIQRKKILFQWVRVSTTIFTRFSLEVLEIGSFWGQGLSQEKLRDRRRILTTAWGFITLFRCFPSYLPPFSDPCPLSYWSCFSIRWPDWQGENHPSLLVPWALLGKQGSSACLLKHIKPTRLGHCESCPSSAEQSAWPAAPSAVLGFLCYRRQFRPPVFFTLLLCWHKGPGPPCRLG